MFIELVLFALLGCGLGILTGLIPGLHVNNISVILLGTLSFTQPLPLAVIIFGMAISHTLWDFIPSILLGAPDSDTALSTLPGHRMLLEGKGYEAIYLTVAGGVGAIILTLMLFPLFILLIPILYTFISSFNLIPWILIGIAAVMIVIEKGKKKIIALFLFLMSGVLGVLVLGSSTFSQQTFLPLFTGLFGISTLLVSINKNTSIPSQLSHFPKIEKSLIIPGIVKGVGSGVVLGTLPGVGASQASILAQHLTHGRGRREFLVSIGAINTIVALFSLISLYTILKPRSGAAVAVSGLLPEFGFYDIMILLAVSLFVTGISSLLLLKSVKKIIVLMQKANYTLMTAGIVLFLVVIVGISTGPIGLLVLMTSTSIGLLAPLYGVKRSSLMGVLMVPLILFYGGLVL